MASSFLRSQSSIRRLLTTRSPSPFKSVPKDPLPPHRTQRHQQRLGFSDFLKRGKEFDAAAAAAPGLISPSLGSSLRSIAFPRVGFVSWYLGMVKSRPILTKSVTCSLIYIASDLSSQTVSLSDTAAYDFLRTSRMAAYGLIVLGPTLHFWFNFMSRVFPKKDLLSTVKKMALGQSVYGPVMTIIFFSMNAALQGEDYTDIVFRLKRDLLPTLLKGIMYWPACDFVTFRFVPVHLQPLVSNGFSYIWTIYLTHMANLQNPSLSP